ncbi:queuine trna-ribosyltransferase [Holotrichia oblita]|uniref:Queuine trna-ribosyltransferase n=1 Tax=Holotrichia oblita TaxID=644536 RepID=A0ACB9TR57_HOLOL|nr:queuine trna-ribosyltransferase [Holotrichia oblita]
MRWNSAAGRSRKTRYVDYFLGDEKVLFEKGTYVVDGIFPARPPHFLVQFAALEAEYSRGERAHTACVDLIPHPAREYGHVGHSAACDVVETSSDAFGPGVDCRNIFEPQFTGNGFDHGYFFGYRIGKCKRNFGKHYRKRDPGETAAGSGIQHPRAVTECAYFGYGQGVQYMAQHRKPHALFTQAASDQTGDVAFHDENYQKERRGARLYLYGHPYKADYADQQKKYSTAKFGESRNPHSAGVKPVCGAVEFTSVPPPSQVPVRRLAHCGMRIYNNTRIPSDGYAADKEIVLADIHVEVAEPLVCEVYLFRKTEILDDPPERTSPDGGGQVSHGASQSVAAHHFSGQPSGLFDTAVADHHISAGKPLGHTRKPPVGLGTGVGRSQYYAVVTGGLDPYVIGHLVVYGKSGVIFQSGGNKIRFTRGRYLIAKNRYLCNMKFRLEHTLGGGRARAGEITTGHGTILTPVFMPVGTAAAVKGIFHRDLTQEAGAQIILANTYHLYLRPGTGIIEEAGGVHRFSSWEGPMLTDSGGFQVFSLAAGRKLTEEGCRFSSHIDGSKHLFTPENVIDTQRKIGADIMMAFDECPPGDAPLDYAAKSLKLTHRWLDRCFDRFAQTSPLYGHEQSLFPIVQGCTYPELRVDSARYVQQFGADGYAIGGLAVGEPAPVMYEMIELVNGILPQDKPRYLMGVGTPVNILEAIDRGVDMFDCVMPTRNGRDDRSGGRRLQSRDKALDGRPLYHAYIRRREGAIRETRHKTRHAHQYRCDGTGTCTGIDKDHEDRRVEPLHKAAEDQRVGHDRCLRGGEGAAVFLPHVHIHTDAHRGFAFIAQGARGNGTAYRHRYYPVFFIHTVRKVRRGICQGRRFPARSVGVGAEYHFCRYSDLSIQESSEVSTLLQKT